MLVSSFDLGESYGIADSVFRKEVRRPPVSIGNIGVNSPLGWGTTIALDPGSKPVQAWRAAAIEQVRRKDMRESLGWTPGQGAPLPEFQDELTEVLRGHPVDRCHLTVYSVGTVYLRIQFGPDLPLPYLEGFLNCFEFAGYTPAVSDVLLHAAGDHVNSALAREARQLRALTRRERPATVRDAEGYEESGQFTYFRHVLLCVDPGDDGLVPALLADNGIDPDAGVLFEYHGMLHYSPGLYVLEVKGIDDPEDPETSRRSERLLADIEVAHVFEGTCEAFSRLILGEIRAQVEIYSSDEPARADPDRLNRLRTVALAVVNLTQYTLVSPTDEDQGFFTRFDAEAQIDRKHQLITNAVEVLYNVQSAEQQEAASRRANRLNRAAAVLASLTVVSVMVDSYNFVREDEALLPALLPRLVTLVLLLALILVLVRRWGRDTPSPRPAAAGNSRWGLPRRSRLGTPDARPPS
jgi:hypothetical protein